MRVSDETILSQLFVQARGVLKKELLGISILAQDAAALHARTRKASRADRSLMGSDP